MYKKYILLIVALLLAFCLGCIVVKFRSKDIFVSNTKEIELPKPRYSSNTSIEEALLKRRSIRSYKNETLDIYELSQLLWSAQGITSERGFRTAPSAGATYPLEVYVVVGNVRELTPGVYKYNPAGHKLIKLLDGDKRLDLANSALGQSSVIESAVSLVFSAIYERTTSHYGERGIRYVHMEVGHSAENVYLQAVSLKLGTVVIGAFKDEEVKKLLNMEEKEVPLYIMPVGRI